MLPTGCRQRTGTEMKKMTWQPIAEGPLADRAHEAIDSIAACLGSLPPSWPEKHCLSLGYAGMALFFGYRHLASGASADCERSVELLGRSVDAMSEEEMSPALHGGFTGIAWAVEHLRGRVLDPDDEIGLSAIDGTVRGFLQNVPHMPASIRRNYDLMQGLVGLGIYALERVPEPTAVECVEILIDRLEEISEEGSQGISWFTPREVIPPGQIEFCPDGCYNFSLSHGVPGIVGFLGRSCAAGIRAAKGGALLERAVSWLLANENHPGGACFPTWTVPAGTDRRNSRLAWCYGDAGVSAGLMCAALGAGRDDWARVASRVARRAASLRPQPQILERLDGGLCHGAGGLVLTFDRMYQISGDESLLDGARWWLERTLDLRRPGKGFAGFQAWGEGPNEWQDDPGFLTGAAGIGLALLAAVTPVEPEWDRVLLLPGTVPHTLRAAHG